MEIVEQDTFDSEDIPDLLQYVLPNGRIPDNCTMFGMNFNKRVFNGWVKQPSPCCGAASVAGAWNSLCGFHRDDKDAVQHNNVLDLYREMFKGIIETKQSSFERKLGAPIVLFLEILKYRLEIYGKEIGGKKGFGATKQLVVLIIKQLAKEHLEVIAKNSEEKKDESAEALQAESLRPRSAVECFVELLQLEGCDVLKDNEDTQSELRTLIKEKNSNKTESSANGESDYEVHCDHYLLFVNANR